MILGLSKTPSSDLLSLAQNAGASGVCLPMPDLRLLSSGQALSQVLGWVHLWKGAGALRGDLPLVALDGRLGAYLQERPALARASLSSLDRDESLVGRGVVETTLELARESGSSFVVIDLGPVFSAEEASKTEEDLRGRLFRGAIQDRINERILKDRNARAPQHLWACLRVLDALLGRAERCGVTLLLRNPRRVSDLPNPVELRVLLDELRGAPLSTYLDLPAAHLQSVMRLTPFRETVTTFGKGPLPNLPTLVNLADACGPLYGLFPGQGEVKVAAIAKVLSAKTTKLFVPNPGLTSDEIEEALAVLKEMPLEKEPV